MADLKDTAAACSLQELGFFKKLIKASRAIDDNVIPRFNGLSTRADVDKACTSFFSALTEAYEQRERAIRQCIFLTDDRIQKAKDSINKNPADEAMLRLQIRMDESLV
eukprot:jgi/Hompol1/3232/HPOL_006417-RA